MKNMRDQISDLRSEIFELRRELKEACQSSGIAWDLIADIAVTYETRKYELELVAHNITAVWREHHPKE